MISKLAVLGIELIVSLVINWVVRFVTPMPISRVFPGNNGLILITLTKLKVLVLNNSRVRSFSISIVDYSISLMVILI